ncbi:MAG: apolipoprotein N-acyltransferase, partial [Actinomycetota bacterium]
MPAPLLAGLLVAASMPPWGWWPLGLAGLAAYASIAHERRAGSPFGAGFWFGLGWFLPATAWM